MEYYDSLVAGGDDPGYRDGDFSMARFSGPTGLAFDDSGDRLFVADSDNNRIRLINLNGDNRVVTLAGTGAAGHEDGPLSKASFNQPTALAFIPPNQLAVFDSGSCFLRVIDLKSQKVTTAPGGPLGRAWSLVYQPKEGSLYISEPEKGWVQKLDWKTQKIETILANNVLIPHPKVLGLYRGGLYIADREMPTIYRVDTISTSGASPIAVTLVEAGKGDHIQAFASSDNILYALQCGPAPLARILPENSPVSLITPWGFLIENENPLVEPFLKFEINSPTGFAASPKETRKLFISRPSPVRDCIYSVEDYNFDKSVLADAPLDFNYPIVKPPRTFRILILGDSRMARASTYVPGLRESAPGIDLNAMMTHSNRMNTFSKQLEFLLNREAAIDGIETRFQVLMSTHIGQALTDYLYYDVPTQVGKYDVDLVLGLAGWSDYDGYFQKPLTPQGIPAEKVDPEFVLRPLSARIPPGAPARFYKKCVEKGLIKDGQSPPDGNPSGEAALAIIRHLDAGMRGDLMDMDGPILRLFDEKLQKMTTSAGTRPKFLVFFTPWRQLRSINDDYESYWRDLCKKSNVGFLDLCPAYYALEPSFYPTNDAFNGFHYNEYGQSLIAYLLSHYLPGQKWIPFNHASN